MRLGQTLLAVLTVSLLAGLVTRCRSSRAELAASPDAGTVVLLHGLGRTAHSLSGMARYLRRAGYEVVNIGYPSRKHRVEVLVTQLAPRLEEVLAGSGTSDVAFVTHSLGGILLRAFVAERGLEGIGRVVMLSPPNQGSGVTDQYRDVGLYRVYTGPAGQQLGSESNSVPNQLGPVEFELGVITGNRSLNPLLSSAIPGPDDGKVAVDKARVEGMKDFLVVPHTHTFIMSSRAVQEQVVHFLRTGAFKKDS
jgi:pimeloyl-ACP methyl ester carboxylesterase